MQENTLVLGFKSVKELFLTVFGLKTPLLNLIGSFFATLTTFITKYIWDDAGAVYFLAFMILVDAITGIWKAFKYNTFSSSRLPRILVTLIIYTTLLAISWNAAKYSPFYFWLPATIYGGFVSVLVVSIIENLVLLGYLPRGLYDIIKEKASFKKIFGVQKNKDKDIDLEKEEFKSNDEKDKK